MRINPVEHGPGFWSLHWPWWRTKVRAALSCLSPRVRCVLRSYPEQMERSGHSVEGPVHQAVTGGPPTKPWSPPSQPDTSPIDRDWPSDQPLPPPQQLDVRIDEDPPRRETGEYFDFLI